MSYEFFLTIQDTHATANGEPSEELSSESTAEQIDPAAERRKAELASALIQQNSQLEVFQFGFDRIAEAEGISVEEAQTKYRHLELNGPEDGNGIQISLFDNTAFVTVPFWHSGQHAVAVLQEIWAYLGVISSLAKYAVYDSQLGEFISLDADFDRVLQHYASGVSMTEDLSSD